MIEDEFVEVDTEEESDSYIFHIDTKTKNPNIKSLRLDWVDKTLQIPKYQRRFVWTMKQACLFIESLMLDLPIPTLMFLVDEYGNNLIIDGQQRIKTILYFIGAIKPEEVSPKEYKFINFKLQGLPKNSPWENLDFEHFSEVDKKKLLDKSLDITYITLQNPKDLRGIFYIFERLNKNGTILQAQEIRNCIYSGSFNDFLLELNKYSNWRKIFTSNEDECRQRDVELILRFFALYDRSKNYTRPMKEFLSDYMSDSSIRNMCNNELAKKKILFELTVDAIINNLGNKPFNVKSKLNASVLDSVMIAFANNLDNIPKDIYNKFRTLCKNNEYYNYCGKSADSVEFVKNRIQMANDYLFGKVEDIKLKVIKLFELPVSAGFGNFIDDNTIPSNELFVDNRKADFALRITGNSMEPQYHDGDIILVRKQANLANGDIGIFIYDGEVRCKKYSKHKKNISLTSLNKQYQPINISSNRRLDILGLVIGTYVSNEE